MRRAACTHLIVECLTQHRTWIPQQKQRQQNKKKTHIESEEIVRKRVCINYLPCNLMEIFAIYFPFCQWFFSSCSPDVSVFFSLWLFFALSRFTFDTHSLQYLGMRLASKKQSLLRKSSWKVWNQGIFLFILLCFSLSLFFWAMISRKHHRIATKRHKTIYYFLSRQNAGWFLWHFRFNPR